MRLANSNDNEQLMDLCKSAPMEGIITAFVDQSPDFFAMPSVQGEGYKIWVEDSKEENKLAGCIVETYKTVNYNGGVHKAFYVGDLKVRPENRGTLGIRLTSQMITGGIKAGFPLGECYIIDGNEKALKVLEYLGTKIYEKVHSGMANIYQIMPFRKYSVPEGYKIREAKIEDLDSIIEILKNQYCNYTASPIFSKDYFDTIFKATETFSIKDFRVAEKYGEIVAVAAFWDQSTIRRTVVKTFSTKAKILVNFLKIIKPIAPIPKLPNEGDPLQYIYLRYSAIKNGEINALRAIIANESNNLKKLKKYHFIWASFHEADSLVGCIDNLWKMSMKVNIFHMKFNDSIQLIPPEVHKTKPVYVDFSVV